MQKDAHFSQIQLLKVDGGASNNNLLMQMQADALQVQRCWNTLTATPASVIPAVTTQCSCIMAGCNVGMPIS